MSTTVNILSNDDGYLDALAQVDELGNLFVWYTDIFNMFGIFLHFSNTSSMHLWVKTTCLNEDFFLQISQDHST